MLQRNFTTIVNDGISKKYVNTCFWISIADFFTYVKGEQVDPDSLREMSGFNGTNAEFFDFFDESHRKSLVKLCTMFAISVDFHYANIQDKKYNKGWLSPKIVSVGSISNTTDKLAIAAFGNHFELLISETDTIKDKSIVVDAFEKDERLINYFEPETIKEHIKEDLTESDMKSVTEYLNHEVGFYEKLINGHNKEIESLTSDNKKLISTIVEVKNRLELVNNERKQLKENIKSINSVVINAKIKKQPSFRHTVKLNELLKQYKVFSSIAKNLEGEINDLSHSSKIILSKIESIMCMVKDYDEIISDHNKKINVLN